MGLTTKRPILSAIMRASRSAGGSDCAGLLECRADFANDRERLVNSFEFPSTLLISSSFTTQSAILLRANCPLHKAIRVSARSHWPKRSSGLSLASPGVEVLANADL